MTEQISNDLSKTEISTKTDSQIDINRKLRLGSAFVLAAISDLTSAWLEAIPPLQWLLDLLTAAILFLLLGRQWLILPGLIAEAIPGLALFPSWLLVVGSISAFGEIRNASTNRNSESGRIQ